MPRINTVSQSDESLPFWKVIVAQESNCLIHMTHEHTKQQNETSALEKSHFCCSSAIVLNEIFNCDQFKHEPRTHTLNSLIWQSDLLNEALKKIFSLIKSNNCFSIIKTPRAVVQRALT